MDQATWDAVDAYVNSTVVHEDDALRQAVLDSESAGLPSIAVTPALGKLLYLFAKMVGASRILEIGTLGGYSGIWMARALRPGGRLTSLEISQKHADVAMANFVRAGVAESVELIVAPAIETLATLEGPFDMVFIDADKQSTADYFAHAVPMCRAGAVIVVDNVVRGGTVADLSDDNEAAVGIRRFNDSLPNFPNVTATAIQTVGAKGYDGFTLVFVN